MWSEKQVLKCYDVISLPILHDLALALSCMTLYDNNICSAFSGLWNAMIYPFLNMTIKGAIWYQGESNASKHNHLSWYMHIIAPKPVIHPCLG